MGWLHRSDCLFWWLWMFYINHVSRQTIPVGVGTVVATWWFGNQNIVKLVMKFFVKYKYLAVLPIGVCFGIFACANQTEVAAECLEIALEWTWTHQLHNPTVTCSHKMHSTAECDVVTADGKLYPLLCYTKATMGGAHCVVRVPTQWTLEYMLIYQN